MLCTTNLLSSVALPVVLYAVRAFRTEIPPGAPDCPHPSEELLARTDHPISPRRRDQWTTHLFGIAMALIDESRERSLDPSQLCQALPNRGQFDGAVPLGFAAMLAIPECEKFFHLLQAEAEPLRSPNESQPPGVTFAVAADPSRGAVRLGKEAPALVVAHRLHIDSDLSCQRSDGIGLGHIDSVVEYGLKVAPISEIAMIVDAVFGKPRFDGMPSREGSRTLGALAAVLASACDLGPLVPVLLGVSDAWIGNLAHLEPYRPFFLGAAAPAPVLRVAVHSSARAPSRPVRFVPRHTSGSPTKSFSGAWPRWFRSHSPSGTPHPRSIEITRSIDVRSSS